jgi:hypothetical protein
MVTVSTTELFQRHSIDLRLGGRYSLANKRDLKGNRREFACRTTRVSPFQMMISVPVIGSVGERVISYFGEFGKLDGWIADLVDGGFMIDLAVAKDKREQLAGKISWLEKQQREIVRDARAQERMIPENPHSTLIFVDGSQAGCFVIDMSVSGAAVSADVQPEIGSPLAIGRSVGRVIRHFREGFAVKFIKPVHRDFLEQLIIKP